MSTSYAKSIIPMHVAALHKALTVNVLPGASCEESKVEPAS